MHVLCFVPCGTEVGSAGIAFRILRPFAEGCAVNALHGVILHNMLMSELCVGGRSVMCRLNSVRLLLWIKVCMV